MINCPIYFAPLQGYTDAPYRNHFHSCFGGVDAYYAPFVRIEKRSEFRNREVKDIDPLKNSVPTLVPQGIASTPDELRLILQLFEQNGYKSADLNLGCPFPLLAKRHKGSGLLPFPDEVEALFEVFQEFPSLSLSVKARLGWSDPEEIFRLLPLFEKYSIARLVLHPRLGVQQYKGEVDMNTFSRFYEACPVPLVYNGDLRTVDEIESLVADYPRLSGIMLGRGLLADPSLALVCKSGKKLSDEEFRARLFRLHAALLEHYSSHYQGGDYQVLTKMKTFWEYLWQDADKRLKKKIIKSNKMDTYQDAVGEIFRV